MRWKIVLIAGLVLTGSTLAACGDDGDDDPGTTSPDDDSGTTSPDMTLTSTAFAEGQAIPAEYTCTGDDHSPPLAWEGAPSDAQRFVLIMDDPDAPSGTWVHWVVYNLPGETRTLPAAIQSDDDLPGEAVHGMNSWRRNDYGGPCPPSGTHRYVFKLYALSAPLDLRPGATKSDVITAIENLVVAEGRLTGTYRKP
jgi:Raf kinase inhibitor-like YbhB/YbcL family protein